MSVNATTTVSISPRSAAARSSSSVITWRIVLGDNLRVTGGRDSKVRLGAVFGTLAGLGYAFTVICGRNLSKAGLNVTTVLSIRFAISGFVLVGVCLARRITPRPVRGEWLGIFLLGAIGYMTESSF